MKALRILLPFVIVVVAVAGALYLWRSRPEPARRDPTTVLPVVRVHTVAIGDFQMTVTSQGTVTPRIESVLVPEVSGRVIEVAPSFAPGGFFAAGDVLLRIDPHDYRQALIQTRWTEAQARMRLAQVQAEADLARREWDALGRGEASALTLFEPQLAEAQAALDAALAGVDRASTDLARTELRAPYAGRVLAKQADLGQMVNRGAALATIYAVDVAEVRLPLPDEELAFIDLPLGYRGESPQSRGPATTLRTRFAGRVHEWTGRIVRTEGVIDPRSRMVHAVAAVRDPYGRGSDATRPPLAAGMFVEAEITGRLVEGVAVIPRAALRSDGRVLVLDDEDRLHFREISVLRAMRDEVIVEQGLAEGERVCVSPLAAVVDGMRVAVAEGA